MMQIRSIVLYNDSGAMRPILFNEGELNIITGASRKGKSNLISILRYLLGSGSPHAPTGPIRDTVTWYGLHARIGPTSFYIARPAPAAGSETNHAMLTIGVEDPLAYENLSVNTTSDGVRAYLGNLIGIDDNVNVPDEGQTRRALTATFVHSLYYCFQGQGEVANPDILFHRQNRDYQTQTIRDTLPYFLGAQGSAELETRNRIRTLRRELRRTEDQMAQYASIQETGLGKMRALISAARAYGIAPEGAEPLTVQGAIDVLAGVLEAEWAPPIADNAFAEYDALLSQAGDLRDRISQTEAQINRLRDFQIAREGYERELEQQSSRLTSLRLVPDADIADSHCPVCERPFDADDPTAIGSVRETFAEIESRLSSVDRDSPRIHDKQVELRGEVERLRDEHTSVVSAIDALNELRQKESDRARQVEMRSFVAGRISQYLEQFGSDFEGELSELTARRDSLQRRIDTLQQSIDSDAIRSRTESALRLASRRMSEFASRLDLEHARSGVRIDLARLTVVADLPSGPAYMSDMEIGSGMNWVGYHLCAYLALQEFFIENGRPVPSFVVFDQPTQVFFPEDGTEAGEMDELGEDDRSHARNLFRLLHDVVQELSGQLQVIVLDHADFADDWFQESVVARWRGDEALIPKSWIEELSTDAAPD